MEFVYNPELKLGGCFICGLPGDFLMNGCFTIRKNELWLCPDCYKNKEEMEKIKLHNHTLYNEIVEVADKQWHKLKKWSEQEKKSIYYKYEKEIDYEHIRIFDGCPQWLTSLSIDELRSKAKEFCKPDLPKGVEINGKIIHEDRSIELLCDEETFLPHPEIDVHVSNFGRVKCNNEILEQIDPDKNNPWKSGYLFVDIKGIKEPLKVYRLVAETWLKKPNNDYDPSEKAYDYTIVHHISNNGYDNRIENLMWVTNWQHIFLHEIPQYMDINNLNIEELFCIILSHRRIKITQNDYPNVLKIAKRGYQLVSDECKETWLHWIVPFENLVNNEKTDFSKL